MVLVPGAATPLFRNDTVACEDSQRRLLFPVSGAIR